MRRKKNQVAREIDCSGCRAASPPAARSVDFHFLVCQPVSLRKHFEHWWEHKRGVVFQCPDDAVAYSGLHRFAAEIGFRRVEKCHFIFSVMQGEILAFSLLEAKAEAFCGNAEFRRYALWSDAL